MEFSLLGPVDCTVAGTPVPLGRPQERCLLAVLAVELGRVVPLDRLVELLWDDEPPERARSIVHTHISRLRSTLRNAGAEAHGVRLVTRGPGYLLDAPPDRVDLHRFQRRVLQAREAMQAGDAAAAADGLAAALAWWRGPALADVATQRVRERICVGLDELRTTATEDRIEADLALGRHREVIGELTALAAQRPLRERSVGLLMLALYRSGQQAQALERFRAARRMLIDDLGIEPGPDLRRLEQAILSHDPSLGVGSPPLAPPSSALAVAAPASVWRGPRSHLTSIVGRERQVAELTRLLLDHRLVTVVGAGGVGKTTLALHAAEAIVDGPPVVVAALATARDADDVVLTLAGVLGVGGATMAEVGQSVESRLAESPHLLILDNCEHLVTEISQLVRRMLSRSARLVVLATSRQRLNLPEETVWRLEPLSVAGPGDGIPGSPAATLFLRRAAGAVPGFVPSASDLDTVDRVCRRVEGLPLALELAAARLRTLSLPELARQLDQGFGVLGPDSAGESHGNTLAATIDWSYRLLSADEQQLLAGLAVFRGGFTASAATAVCGAEPSLLNLLVDRSLVQPYPAPDGQRYRLLEVVRQYAETKLAESGDRYAVAGRHVAYWLDVTREIMARPHVDEQFAAWTRLAADLDDLRAAASDGYATDRIPEAVELALMMLDCLTAVNAYAEQGRWLDELTPHLPNCPPSIRCLGEMSRSHHLTMRDDPAGALALARPIMDDLAAVHTLMYYDARLCNVRNGVHLLDPAAADEAPILHDKLQVVDDKHTRVHSLTMAAEALNQWGHDEAALALWDGDDLLRTVLDDGDEMRYRSIRLLNELGAGELTEAAVTARRLRDKLVQPGYLTINTPAYSLALYALVTQSPPAAAVTITGLIEAVSEANPPALSRAYALRLLLAEAQRRAGNLGAALAGLRDGLATARTRTTYSWTTPSVLTAASLAADLGDSAAAQRLADAWDRVRTPLGLPAPVGFRDQAERLGLDRAAGPVTAGAWREEPLRDLLATTEAWVLSR